jgi:glycosyltransferase involved in cell wall biosynthesis
MTNAFEGRLVSVGTPRIDRQLGTDRTTARARLAAHGIDVGAAAEIVLYAPTWRGDFDRPDDDVEQLRRVVELARAPHRAVLLKVHERVYDHARRHPELRDVLVPNALPTNELLAGVDVLVTDYSSVWVDVLATGRPVLFHAPDLDEYATSRRFNLEPEQWPGPISRTPDDLRAHLDEAAGSGPAPAYAQRYAAARTRYCPNEDGAATERVLDVVFRNRGAHYDVRGGFRDGRTRLLVHLGSLQPNGITSAALSLLHAIDTDRFDVSAWFAETGRAGQLETARLIDERVRLFVLPSWPTGSKVRVRARIATARRPGRGQRALAASAAELMRVEWTRAFGVSSYEHVIDFSGYEPYWIKLLTARPSGSLSIWLHNDIAAELTNRRRSGRLRSRLRGAVALYRTADHLVSVSRTLSEVNANALRAWAPPERFTYARNAVDAERIRAAAGERVARPTAVQTFITVGRLSAEKNHLRLVDAFRAVHEASPATRLVIVGDGPLLPELRARVAELGLAGAVELTGAQDNPFPAMRAADCFVLSSDYEGQPMVLLEALVLGLPVIATRFDTVLDALPAGCGLIVERDVDALAAGMQRFLSGEVAPAPFDAARYNAEVRAEFCRAIGADAARGPGTW